MKAASWVSPGGSWCSLTTAPTFMDGRCSRIESTVQGTLADAIERITGERVLPQGSGRTDAGVHALGQVASFALAAAIPAANFHRALNRALPASIRVLETASVSPDFHARHHAVGKRYEYRIFRGEICPPWISRYVYALNWPLDLDAMREAAAMVVGEHDFASFAASDPDLAQRAKSVRLWEKGFLRSRLFFLPAGMTLIGRFAGVSGAWARGFCTTWCGIWWGLFWMWGADILRLRM